MPSPALPFSAVMDMDTPPIQSRLEHPARVAETATPFSLAGPDRSTTTTTHQTHHRDAGTMQRTPAESPSLLYRGTDKDEDDATSTRPKSNFPTRDSASTGSVANDSQTAGHSASLRNEHRNEHDSLRHAQPLLIKHQQHQHQPAPLSSNSQDTTSTTNDTDRVFTPPVSEGGLSNGNGNGKDSHNSSQESQLLQLSQLVAAQEKMPVSEDAHMTAGLSRKRMADGVVKHTRERSSASPVFPPGGGHHSRNTSTVSIASTAGSRIGEVSLRFLHVSGASLGRERQRG